MSVSMRTMVIGLVGLGAIAVVRTFVALSAGEPATIALVSDVGEAAVVLFAAAVVLVSARFLPHPGCRACWTLLGLGCLSFAIGDIVWALIEVGSGGPPFPGPPDVFYLLQYAFFHAAVLIAAYRMREGGEADSAALIAGLSTALLLGLVYVGLIEPVLLVSDMSVTELVLTAVYPVADIALFVGPAIFVTIMVFRSAERASVMPWIAVTLAATVLAASDAAFAWMSALGIYEPGSIVDHGWMVAFTLVAVAASLALDAQLEARSYGVRLEPSEPTRASDAFVAATGSQDEA